MSKARGQTSQQRDGRSDFPQDLQADSLTDSKHVKELMATVLADEFYEFSSHFMAFCWRLVTLKPLHLEQTLDLHCRSQATQKHAFGQKKMFSSSKP